MKDIIENLNNFISKYVEESINENYEEKDNFDLKFEHTIRVKDNILELSKRLNFNESEKCISEIIGLLHDIGRFKQYRLYKSFSDAVTGSHATHSVQMIDEFQLLACLSDNEQELIKSSIEYHNHFLIPSTVKGDLLKYSSLIRDADKLDAFYLETLLDEKRIYKLGSLSSERDYSDEVIDDIKQNRQVDFSNIKYKYDRRLGILGLIFNLEYLESLEYVRDNNYVEKLIDAIPQNDELDNLRKSCLDYINEKVRLMSLNIT